MTKIEENARCLVDRLGAYGISVTGVTKGVCGHPDVAGAMVDGGVAGLADARITNIVRMRMAGITCPVSMLRAPMASELEAVIRHCDTSYNTEMDTILKLGLAAEKRGASQDIILIVEMGDGREGILPEALNDFATLVIATPWVALKGIAANFACMGSVAPTAADMITLSRLADSVEGGCGPFVDLVSGGGSANVPWALGEHTAWRVNNLRLGEAILLGLDPVTGRPIDGLHTDAFALFAEVIEARGKPGTIPHETTPPDLGPLRIVGQDNPGTRVVLAVGQQDTDAGDLTFPSGFTFVGATSDHTVVDTGQSVMPVGSEMKMGMRYGALMRAMSARDVAKAVHGKRDMTTRAKDHDPPPFLTLV
nr:alanine racemase [Cognatishimia sp. F0-27]